MSDFLERVRKALAGRYGIERRLGAGGMALVYLADDPKHQRQVAVKVLRPELAAAVGADRFLQEIRVTARLQHPHILPLYDSGESDGLLFYVMPYVEGESLADRLQREGQLSLEDAIQIAREVADGLRHAHSNGVIHRDIKPENILFSSGHAVIADFGVARAVSAAGESQITTTGLAIGTPAYMSPEQGAGESQVDGRSDVYSLACVLYQMLAGGPPFMGPNAQAIIARKSMEAAPRITVMRDSVPPHIEHAVLKALARSPADRFPTVQQFADALQLTGEARLSFSGFTSAIGAVPAPDHSIAVLPFVNMSADPENEYLSDGISEELIHALAKFDDLNVAARTSSFAFKGQQEDVRIIGQRLNVRSVLEGSVRRVADRLRVTAQLVNIEDGFELWSGRFEREVDDVFAVQDEISSAILAALKLQLMADDTPAFQAATDNFAAYELYLKGRFAWNKRTEEGINRSVDYLKEAIEEDPGFSVAHAALADSYITLGIYGAMPPTDVMPLALTAADRALALDGKVAQAVAARGCARALYEWDWVEAERDFQQALELDPRYPTAHQWYAVNCLAPRGRFAEAREALRQAHRLDPLSLAINASRGLLAYFEREFDRAINEYQKMVETDPTFGTAYYFLGQALEQKSRYDDAIEAFERAIEFRGNAAEVLASLAHTYAAAGKRAEAEAILKELTERSAERHVSPALIGLVHLGLGDADRGFEWLEKALVARSTELVWLQVRPTFDVWRADPRFVELTHRLHLAEAGTPIAD